ncbi:hypothetical protein ABOM_005473 [Aspergillus bombycis]|uniref:Carrier domain-containing protein n=1 Tax=Aspergillus bombycis TaxID=109264 RepID=A0A1F8A239_9EURO|nr:hypothetical protein ABOM_005473 [Aspergillus bombycis]OGM45784.1 hypothetical protein ABOM_005473 [Aspergillus bombycis]
MPSTYISPQDEYQLAVKRNEGLGQLFYEQVQRQSSSLAVVDGGSSLTYDEVHKHACRVAKTLSLASLALEEPVGIIVNHGLNDVLAQMGTLYAGGTCTPMDPSLPDQQIRNRLEKLQTRFVLVDGLNKTRDLPFTQILLDDMLTSDETCTESWEEDTYPVLTDLSHRAHIIHTSGTTSEPKAVQIAARSILQVVFHAPFEPVNDEDVVAHVNKSSFDVALFDIWAPLLRGARIAVLSTPVLLDLTLMTKHIDLLGITVMATTTALLNLAASTFPRAFSKLRLCFIGGEAANAAAIQTIFNEGPPAMLINAYGPTECCIFCLAHQITPKDLRAGSVSIGKPIGQTIAYIADEAGKESDEGELWIGGAGVSPGYVDQPEKNAESFIIVDNTDTPSNGPVRLYRTGDLVRRRQDGQIDYIGRRDHQVKIRGFRVELGAIQSSLLRTGHFSEVAAMKVELPQAGAGSLLAAYATPADPNSPPETALVLKDLRNVLPDYMIPQLEVIPKMPLNSHCKVDRRYLAALFCQRWTDQQQDAMSYSLCKDTRSILAGLWANLLANPRPTYEDEDDFFALGGTSLQASLLISQIRRAFSCEISLLALYDNSTLGALTNIIDHCPKDGSFATVRNETDIWVADSMLADDIPIPVGPPVNWQSDIEGRVFFTGATGFVGAFMLADLLHMPKVHQIGCLVRAKDAEVGMKRLETALAKYGLWDERFRYKLLAFPGLLEEPYLGLGQARFNELANWASVVFHLGARVNYTQPYSLHRPANTLGTVNVVRFACAGRNKPVHYVSSISCFGPTGFVTGSTTVGEDEALLPHLKALAYDHGYAQSQWVAEQLLRRLMGRGFPIAVYRPGFITGHSQTGACNPDDFFSRLIFACLELGCYPQLPNQRKEFISVDYVNSAILHIAGDPANLGHAFHIVPPTKDNIDMDASMELLNQKTDSVVERVPYSEWIDRLSSKTPKSLQPLLPMLAEKVQAGLTRWELYENMPQYQTKNLMRALQDYPGGLEFRPLDSALMEKYVDYLRRHSSWVV